MTMFREGQRVKVIKVSPDDIAYHDTLGKFGTIEGVPWEDESGTWVFVLIDGETIGCEFKTDELELVNVTIVEGEVQFGSDYMVGGEYFAGNFLAPLEGKRVRITIEELEVD